MLAACGNAGRSALEMVNRNLFRNGRFEGVAEKV